MCDEIISEESFAYDAAGNLTGAPSSSFVYDTNNRLTTFNCFPITYDADGNMICNTAMAFEYDSANRLINAGGQKYTYNAEDVRICKYDGTTNTKYLYDTNCRLSRLLMKTTNGVVTKYLYGVDLIGEQTSNGFKTYHYDNRGSVVAMVDAYGIVTDTFEYDTYGKVTQHIGSSDTIFRYNGRDGVVTDENGLIYMRARYYSPAMRRFINADIIPGELSNAITLNRYAYANGNPVSNVDPFGLSAERGGNLTFREMVRPKEIPYDIKKQILDIHEKNEIDYYYNDDYQEHASIKIDDQGNITYIFTNHSKGILKERYKTTYYYFEVNDVEYWKSLLDFDVIYLGKIFDNKIINNFKSVLEFAVPPESGFTELEYYSALFDVTTDVMASLLGNQINHNTELSQYLYDKVMWKGSEQDVAILKSVTTYKGEKYNWQDSYKVETKELTLF